MPYFDAVLSTSKRAAEAPIEPGKQDIQATVKITFAIR